MFIAHLSDIHFSINEDRAEVNIEKIINNLNGLDKKPDLVLITGDLIHDEKTEWYKTAFEYLNDLNMPYLVIPGNHDNPKDLMEFVGKNCPSHPKSELSDNMQYVCDDYDVRIIALDSYEKNCHSGYLCNNRLKWLEEKLKDNPDNKPVLIMMHHFPDYSSMPSFDKLDKKWFENFQSVIKGNNQNHNIKLILSGHLHNCYNTEIDGIRVNSAPSVNVEVMFNMNNKEIYPDFDKKTGYLLHLYNGDKFTTISQYL